MNVWKCADWARTVALGWVGLMAAPPAHAVALLTFDDELEIGITNPGNFFHSYAGDHHGFTFDDYAYVIRACQKSSQGSNDYAHSGYCKGAISPEYTLYGAWGKPIRFARSVGTLFSIYGLYVTPAWSDGLRARIEGFRGGKRLYQSEIKLRSPQQPFYAHLNFIGIDSFRISSLRVSNLQSPHLAFDNIEYAMGVCPTMLSRYNNTSPVILGSRIYFAYSELDKCWGRLTSSALDPKSGVIAAQPYWDAACNLTATANTRACAKSNVRPTMPSFTDNVGVGRYLVVNDADRGVRPFQAWALAPLPARERALLAYLRGDRSAEGGYYPRPGRLRTRTALLGDIINSSPVGVGAPSGPWETQLQDRLHGTLFHQEAQAYTVFKSRYAHRRPVVYVGANDGFLHGFSAGDPSDGPVPLLPPDAVLPRRGGPELLGYMPATVWANLKANTRGTYSTLDFSSPDYAHHFYVDATPVAGDVFYAGAWHTLLATGLGAGGPGTQAHPPKGAWSVTRENEHAYGTLSILDVTNPAHFSQSGAALLFQEISALRPVQCIHPAPRRSAAVKQPCLPNLGAQYGTPSIVRMHNGDSALLFGNGLYSENGNAGVFVLTIARQTGRTQAYYLHAGPSTVAGQKNGITYATPLDIDTDGVVDYIYGGDVQGNVWRFDVTAQNPLDWHPVARPFASPQRQPITTAVAAHLVEERDQRYIMLGFGTGRVWPLESPEAPQYVRGGQSIYGIWDWNVAGWNQLSDTRLAGLERLPSGADLRRHASTTLAVSGETNYRKALNPLAPCWIGARLSGHCSTASHYGWEYPLPAPALLENEQVVSSPSVVGPYLVTQTIIPRANTGFTMLLNLRTGKPPPAGTFRNTDRADGINGVQLNATGAPVALRGSDGLVRLYFKNTAQATGMVEIDLDPSPPLLKRLTWRILR